MKSSAISVPQVGQVARCMGESAIWSIPIWGLASSALGRHIAPCEKRRPEHERQTRTQTSAFQSTRIEVTNEKRAGTQLRAPARNRVGREIIQLNRRRCKEKLVYGFEEKAPPTRSIYRKASRKRAGSDLKKKPRQHSNLRGQSEVGRSNVAGSASAS